MQRQIALRSRLPWGATAALLIASTACMPGSVRAVDEWLIGLERGDDDAVVAWSHPRDRDLVASALQARASDPTALLSLALPPQPLEHYFVEIERKSEDGRRHVVETELTLKNPLPYASEKVGQSLEGIPKTRKLVRYFASVRVPNEGWRVFLDLSAVVARAEFVERFQAALEAEDWARAGAMLASIPPPPDDPAAQKDDDRMEAALQSQLERAVDRSERIKKARTSTGAASRDEPSSSKNPGK